MLAHSSYGWRKMSNDTLKAVGLDKVDYRPYSLRRGGATHFFTFQGSFDKLLVLGGNLQRLRVFTWMKDSPFWQIFMSPVLRSPPIFEINMQKVSHKPCQNLTMHWNQCRAGQPGRSTTKSPEKRTHGGCDKGWSPVSWVWPDPGNPKLHFGQGVRAWPIALGV